MRALLIVVAILISPACLEVDDRRPFGTEHWVPWSTAAGSSQLCGFPEHGPVPAPPEMDAETVRGDGHVIWGMHCAPPAVTHCRHFWGNGDCNFWTCFANDCELVAAASAGCGDKPGTTFGRWPVGGWPMDCGP